MHRIRIRGIRFGYLDVTQVSALDARGDVLVVHLKGGQTVVYRVSNPQDLADVIYDRKMGTGGPHIDFGKAI